MTMDFAQAAERIQLGESLQQLAVAYREALLIDLGLDPETAEATTLRADTHRFMNQLCRHLSDRHAGDARVGTALADWVRRCDEYEAYDALLSAFRFEGREAVVRKGRQLFPGPLTAHWDA